MRASDLRTNFFEPRDVSHDVPAQGTHKVPEKLLPHAGGESVQDSGFDEDEFTPEQVDLEHGED
jgi:hypothetical protein